MHHLEAPSGEVFLALLQGWAGEDYGESSGDLELLPGTWGSCSWSTLSRCLSPRGGACKSGVRD